MTLDNEPPNDQAISFEELAASFATYDTQDLLSTIGALQLIPDNASSVTRLEAASHAVASLAPTPGCSSKISVGRLRQLLSHPALTSLMPYEDPAENQFAEEFTFFGGSYLVLPGIAQAGEFMLSNLCKAVFLSPDHAFPIGFRSRAFQIVSSSLNVMHTAAQQAGIRRGTHPSSSRYSEIVIPPSATFERLKNAATFKKMEFESTLAKARLPADALSPLISDAGQIDLNEYNVANGPLLWKPFVRCGETIILGIPGMVVSAIRQGLVKLAYEWRLQNDLANLYKRAVWQNVIQSLGFTQNDLSAHRPSRSIGQPNMIDGFFRLDYDKILYCLLLCDP